MSEAPPLQVPVLCVPVLCVVVPVFDDWACCAELLRRLPKAVALGLVVVVVDDGSVDPVPDGFGGKFPGELRLLRLVRNVGHQKAIAVGLQYAVETVRAPRIVVMDADGEDRPEDISALLAALPDDAEPRHGVVVAQRARRSEGWRFALFYWGYKRLFRALTGERVDFGNFCLLGQAAARRLVAMHELWLHFPATLVRSRLPLVRVPIDRGVRYAGRSRMNLVSLTTHGFSAVGVFGERAFTRVLLFAGATVAVLSAVLLVALLLKFSGLATPGWVTTIAGTLVVVTIQSAAVALGGLFIVFGNKTDLLLAPRATAAALIEEISVLAPPPSAIQRCPGAVENPRRSQDQD